MKRIFVFLLMIFIPSVVFGLSDSCTKPSKFTIDTRCYVTETDKLTSPYNAVVSIGRLDDPFCTGTIIKYNDKLYLFTAKHCAVGRNSNNPQSVLTINLQNGTSFEVSYKAAGNYISVPEEDNLYGDWAVYEIPYNKNIGSLFTKISTGEGVSTSDIYNARLIGYGGLKVMSDSDIRYFKDKYIDYLKTYEGKEANGTEFDDGFLGGGIWGVDMDYEPEEPGKPGSGKGNKYVFGFINFCQNKDRSYYDYLFSDNKNLKESKCGYYSYGSVKECQGWGGNSGGGIFDSVGKLIAIYTRAKSVIGGEYHAGKDDRFCRHCQIDLLDDSSSGALSEIKVALR